MARLWWTDEAYKESLEAKVATNEWKISVGVNKDPAIVIKVIYGGYKVTYPNGVTEVVNPDKTTVEDIDQGTYDELKVGFEARLEEERKRKQAIEDARIALALKQKNCQHTETSTGITMAAAGCDIHDTWCLECNKELRRSWSTASDRDPDDEVSDWDWWCREHTKLYGSAPKRSDYKVVEVIGSYR